MARAMTWPGATAATWPTVALIGSHELLMMTIRSAAGPRDQISAAPARHTTCGIERTFGGAFGWTARSAAGHDVQVAVSIGVLIERFYGELWNRWNDSAVEDTLSPGFTFRGSLGQQTSDRPGWRRYRDLVREGSADFHNEIVELVCDSGRAAARLRFTGTHTGPLLGLPATQRRFEYAGAAFFTADQRWLTSAWVLGDLDALRRQLS